MSIKNYSTHMNEFNKIDKKVFLSGFSGSAVVSSLIDALSDISGKRAQCIFFDAEYKLLKKAKKPHKHITGITKKIKALRSKKAQIFTCPCNKACLFIPLKQDDKIYGYLLLLHLDCTLNQKELRLINFFMDVSLKEFEKERELATLYDTIRPRAIALSTIHTIHRLLSSTLDMNELIERIARLTLQVVRAKYCSIMLLDDSKKHLIPKAVIDLKNGMGRVHKRHKRIKTGTNMAGKVAKTGKTNLAQDAIYVPLVEEDIIGVLCAKEKIENMPFTKFDVEILSTLAEQAVIAIKNAQLYEEQKKMANGSIRSLAALLDAKSPHTYTHSETFVNIVLAIAEEMKLAREEIRYLRYAALLPDTGKFSIPDEILKKRGGLSKKEFKIIKKQHLESLNILKPLEFLKPVIPIILHHHERYDGTGYPNGLKGDDIPIGARIMAVADAFEAMVSARPYKDTMIDISQALKEIVNNKGSQFDPNVVAAFISVSKKPEFKKLLHESK